MSFSNKVNINLVAEATLKKIKRVRKFISDKKTVWAICFLIIGLLAFTIQVGSFRLNTGDNRTILTIILVSIGVCGLLGFFLLAFL